MTRSGLLHWRAGLWAALGAATLGCGGQSSTKSNGSSTGGTGGTELPCNNPEPVMGIDGAPTGFVRCASGAFHRPERQTCASLLPRPGDVVPLPDASTGSVCTRDEHCTDKPHGHCFFEIGQVGPYYACLYGCVSDSDCAPSELCVCGDPVGRCYPATCHVDSDCDGRLCISAGNTQACGGIWHDFACEKAGDACKGPGDCSATQGCYPSASNGPRECRSFGVCGRPFLVSGEARVAPLDDRARGWCAELELTGVALDSELRALLAEHFARMGQMEHASVAAFARFTLELLSLGAPAELVRDAEGALGDEIEHAKLCFGLASAFAERSLGPGPLPMDGVALGAAFLDSVRTAITEACIGETLAAAEATEAAEHAQRSLVRSIHARIAEDERRHAELGFRFFGWALERALPDERLALTRHFLEQAEAALHGEPEPDPERAAELLAEGLLTPGARRKARTAALEDVILPLARDLFRGSLERAA